MSGLTILPGMNSDEEKENEDEDEALRRTVRTGGRTPQASRRRRARTAQSEAPTTQADLDGMIVVLTGAANLTRGNLVPILNRLNITVVDRVTRIVDLVLCADVNTQTIKATTARNMGIPVVPYRQFGW